MPSCRLRLGAFAGAAVLSGACASTAIGPAPVPFPGAASPRPAVAVPGAMSSAVPTVQVSRLIETALTLRGIPYLVGGESPLTGFDCSGFVRYVFSDQGVGVPRTVREQFAYGRKIDDREIRPGDLLFFSTESPGATHVGIAIDAAHIRAAMPERPFIHAPGENGVVRIEALDSPYWRSRFVGARRLF